ncbi:PAP2 superfamily protein [Haloactinopolyspora alba]|uniref:PAP2 superfamily protein n=2 Tax=Haloactinopolyspora alba TaxID=648780 RepID=A0A2P8EGC4_9ACTN|nr:PAP2 superfamily protein [Haloactinopolyspora alba]
MVLVGIAGTWLSWRYFVDTAAGQRLDQSAFSGSAFGRNTLWRGAEPVLDVVSVPFVVLVLGAAAVIAVMRRRWFLPLQVAVLVGGANITTQLLKHVVLDRPTLDGGAGVTPNSLPSGHTTVAASVAAALLLVVPRGARPAVAVLGAGYAALTGVSTMIGGWHRPSDVVAAFTVVLAWAGLTTVLTALSSPERATAARPGATGTKVAAVFFTLAAVASGTVAASALLRTRDQLGSVGPLTERSDLVPAYVGAAFGVVAAASVTFVAVLIAHQAATQHRTVDVEAPPRPQPVG